MVDIDGLGGHVSVGDRLVLAARDGHDIPAEIVGFRNGLAQAMPFAALDGLGRAAPPVPARHTAGEPHGGTLPVSNGWLGRVLDPLGRPLDGQGPLPAGPPPACAPHHPTRRSARGWGRGSISACAR